MSKQQEDLQPVGEFTEKRKRAITKKALEYTVEIILNREMQGVLNINFGV